MKGALAFLGCLALVGLPQATRYSDPGWAPVLALATLGLAAAYAWLARGQELVPVHPGEVAFLLLAGGGLTTLFWVRARLGVPGVILGDLPLEITWRFGGWAWPTLLLVVLYRRRGEGLRPGGGRRAGILLGTGLLAGSLGFLVHLPAVDGVREHEGLARDLIRPLESPTAIAVSGGPRALTADPPEVTFALETSGGRAFRSVKVQGQLLPGLRVDVSRAGQGTKLTSSHPEVVRATPTESGGWVLEPGRPGSAVVTVRNRRATTWIGVWVVDEGRAEPAPPEEVTGAFRIEAGPARPPAPEKGFADTQLITLRNTSDGPVLGPLYLVLRLPPEAPLLVGPQRTAHPGILAVFGDGEGSGEGEDPGAGAEEDPPGGGAGLPVVEVLPGPRGPWVPGRVLGPGESASVEIRVTGALDLTAPAVEARVFRAWRLP